MSNHPLVRVFPDYGRRWPLWGSVEHDDVILSPADLGLSLSLTAEVRGWMDYWDVHHDADRDANNGWDSLPNRVVWEERGAAIVHRLREELGDDVLVVEQYRESA